MIVEVLLLVAMAAACVGIFSGLSILMQIRALLVRSNEIQSKMLEGTFGDFYDAQHYHLASDLNTIARLATDAKKGLIPNLRYDDWFATSEDVKRWKETELREAASSVNAERMG